MSEKFSPALRLADLNDFIAPSQNCIVSLNSSSRARSESIREVNTDSSFFLIIIIFACMLLRSSMFIVFFSFQLKKYTADFSNLIVWRHLFCKKIVECSLFCTVDGCLKPLISNIMNKIKILQRESVLHFKKENPSH
jgi:hypothetical protein